MKRILLFIIIISIITMTACSKKIVSESISSSNKILVENTDAPSNTEPPTNTDIRTEQEEIYILALDSFMPIDEGLNGNMKYIAIETQTLEDATELEKKAVLKYFKKYNVEIMDESFETLKSKGMVKEFSTLEGILLRVEKVDKISTTEIIIEGSKYRSGTGAIGVRCVIKKENDKWVIQSAKMTWIS